MGAAEQRAKSSKMASDLLKKGIWHGRRMTKPCHANYPNNNEIGSAAYRRMDRRFSPARKSDVSPSVFHIHPSNVARIAKTFGVEVMHDALGVHFNILRFTSHGLRKTRVGLGSTVKVLADGKIFVYENVLSY